MGKITILFITTLSFNLANFSANAYAQQDIGKLAPLLDGFGKYHYAVSNCSAPAQRFFDQGIELYYSFQFAEAVASFREAARLDSNCPMVHWGEALSIAPNVNSRYFRKPEDPKGHGARAVERAVKLKHKANEKERGLIEALRIVYDKKSNADSHSRDVAYSRAMGRLYDHYPSDPDVATLYASSLMTLTPWNYWTPDGKPRPYTEQSEKIFAAVLNSHPDHPGANHFYIHLMENSLHPEKALESAQRLAELVPGSGHIAHMPSHIYAVTGMYYEIIESNVRSLAADKALIAAWGNREFPMSSVSYTASATVHGVHAQDFLHMAWVRMGNYKNAMDSARIVAKMSESKISSNGAAARRYVRPWLTLKRFKKWNEIMKQPLPEDSPPFVQGIWHYGRASALLAYGKTDEAEEHLAQVRYIADLPGMDKLYARVNTGQKLLTIAANVLAGEIAAKKGQEASAVSYLETAIRLEDSLLYVEPPDWGYPVRQTLGEVLLKFDRPEEAEMVYWEDLRRNPETGWSLYGVWQSLLRQGKDLQAREIKKRFVKAWENADTKLEIKP